MTTKILRNTIVSLTGFALALCSAFIDNRSYAVGQDDMDASSTTPRGAAQVLTPEQKAKFAAANPEDITDANFPQTIDSFDYPNAELTDVVKAISELTGKNFIIENNVRGKITIVAPTQITVAEAYRAFLSALAINGFTIVPSGKFLKIRSARGLRDSTETYSGAYFPNSDELITKIFHLKYISADEIGKNLRPLLNSKDGEVQAYAPTNSLIMSDFGSNIERVARILSQLDVPGFEERMEVVPVRFAKSRDIAELIDSIINKEDRSGAQRGRFSSGIPRFGGAAPASGGYKEAFSVIPDERTNTLIIVGNNAGIAKIKSLIEKLDYRIRPEDAGGVNVYYVRHRDAKELETTLTGLAEESKKAASDASKGGIAANPTTSPLRTGPGPGGELGITMGSPQQIFGGDVRIKADPSTNSLLITASKQDHEIVLNILSKIDVPRNQVYVEAVIMEMTNEDKEAVGVNLYQFGSDKYGIARAGFRSSPMDKLLNLATDSGLILSFGEGGTKPELEIAGQKFTNIPNLLGFINILKSVVDVNILSTPQILAMDNKLAEIEVGDTIPVATTTTQSTTTTTGIQREPATIKLSITPHISPGGDSVRMELTQTVKQLSSRTVQAKNLQDSAVVTSDRSIKTEVVVRNGDTVVLGGLMSEKENETVEKVPFLGDIPIIGWLFKARETKKEKVNLLIFITPKIVRTHQDGKNLLDSKIGERIEFIKKNAKGRDPFGQTVDKMVKAKSPGADGESASGEVVPADENVDESGLKVE